MTHIDPNTTFTVPNRPHRHDHDTSDRDPCLHQLFEAQVDARPGHPALICGAKRLTYAELDACANRLARHLIARGAGPGMLIGHYFRRSEAPIIAILAILKAGAGYVPLDPTYPAERIAHILDEADVKLLVTESTLAEAASAFFTGVCVVVDEDTEIDEQPSHRVGTGETGVLSSDLCYVLYTSGSTGRPKGVMIEHRNVVGYARAFGAFCDMSPEDRVFQGFSLGFDASVEEIWMAFTSGATLIVGAPELTRSGEDLGRFLNEQQITFFSTVPTLLALIPEDIASLRVLVLGGEQCPAELVAKWATAGRRMINSYGPTETTVDATAGECRPGEPVTIGKPLDGYFSHVLDEALVPVAPGKTGELYVGGIAVARGYLNRPDLTAERFITAPANVRNDGARLYRTGDLVRETPEGAYEFLGRADSQVKIRGYRIELAEIEAVLLEHPSIRMAVVTVVERDGFKELAAFIVENSPIDRDDVHALMSGRLPAFMLPSHLDVIDEIPRLASGKIDRQGLPAPQTPLVRNTKNLVAPENEAERVIAETMAQLFNVPAVSTTDDFFLDLGGYSLMAAQLVSRLRRDHGLEVAIRDVYAYPTVKELAPRVMRSGARKAAAAAPRQPTSRQVFESQSPWTRRACWTLQALSMYLLYGLSTAGLVLLLSLGFGIYEGRLALSTVFYALGGLMLVGYPIFLGLTIGLKWLIIGRYKPGRYPLWGSYYFRFWLATRIQGMSAISALGGTPIMNLYLRLMGAKIGRHCRIYGGTQALDLVSIGDDTTIGAQTLLTTARIEDGMLVLGTVDVGSRCFVGNHSALGLNTRMGDDTRLDDQSLLPDGTVMAAGESRRGAPAQPASVAVPEVAEEARPKRRPFLFGLLHLLVAEFVALGLVVTALPSLALVVGALIVGGWPLAAASVFVAGPLGILSFCFFVPLVKAVFMRRTKPGVYALESGAYMRKWVVEFVLNMSRGMLHAFYNTIYLQPWMRMLGAKIGPRTEISTVTMLTPDLVTIEGESFFADGAIVGLARTFRGHAEYGHNHIGYRSFVGNNAVLPTGAHLGDNCLVGVQSIPAAMHTPDGTECLGSPAFRLPYRRKVKSFDASVTYKPTRRLYILRYLIDMLRIVLPTHLAGAGFIAFAYAIVTLFMTQPVWVTLLLAPVVGFAVAMSVALAVVGLKWLMMGRFKPTEKPLWSVYTWLNEALNGAYETVGAPAVSGLMGTPFYNWYLRLLGCKIGKHTYVGTTLFSEFDLVEIGDYAAINAFVTVQNHLFEDRIMKSSTLRIGDECTVAEMAIVLYDTEMQQGSWMGPLSLLMKGETLPPFTRWVGIPTSLEGTDENTNVAS